MFKQCSFPLNTMVFNITEHVQGVQYLLRLWRSDGVLNLNTHFYSVVFDLFCIFRENTHAQQLIQAKILYQCPSRNILDFVYGGSHFSTGVIFLRVRNVKNRPLWHVFYTWNTFFYGQGSFPYDEKWPLGRFSTGVVIRRYTGALVPLLSPGLSASITADVNATVLAAVQSATQPLKDEIKLLTGHVASNERCISQLTTENASLSNRVQELENTVVGLEERLEENFSSLDCGLEELEQYGRRNSLRFHNVTLPATSDSDNAIVALCKDKLDVTITTDDICRSHPIGGPNKFDKYQVICRFRNWKIKNKIFTSKRALKGNDDHIFITEDLTAFRQGVVSEMLKAKRANRLHSFWTNDGRMFMKVTAKGYVHRVESIDHLRNLVPPSDEYMYEESEDM